VDFKRRWNSFVDEVVDVGARVTAASGVDEDSSYYQRELITAFRKSLSAQEKIELRQWYEFVKAGGSFELQRDRDLGTMIAFEGKSLKDINEIDGTFTRTLVTGSASYLDPSTGLVTFINTTDVARFPAGKYGSGVIVEGTRDNISTRSESISNAVGGWAETDVTVTDNTTETLDPFGNNNAEKITADDPDGEILFDTSTAISTNDGVFSVYLKSVSGNVAMKLEIRNTTAGAVQATKSITVVPNGPDGNGFTRFDVVHKSSGSVANNWRIVIEFNNDQDTFYAFGAQLEVGVDVLFASEYIKANSGSSVTRNNETLSYATANVVNNEKGSILKWFKPEWIYNKHPDAYLVSIDGGSTSELLTFIINSSGTASFQVNKSNSSSSGGVASAGISSLVQNSFNHIALTWDTTISNGLKIYLAGVLLQTSINSAFSPSDVGTNYDIGVQDDGTSHAFGVFDDFAIRKDVLNAGHIFDIFNRGVGLAEQRNRWPALKLVNRNFRPIRKVGLNRYDFQLLAKEVIS